MVDHATAGCTSRASITSAGVAFELLRRLTGVTPSHRRFSTKGCRRRHRLSGRHTEALITTLLFMRSRLPVCGRSSCGSRSATSWRSPKWRRSPPSKQQAARPTWCPKELEASPTNSNRRRACRRRSRGPALRGARSRRDPALVVVEVAPNTLAEFGDSAYSCESTALTRSPSRVSGETLSGPLRARGGVALDHRQVVVVHSRCVVDRVAGSPFTVRSRYRR